MLEKIESMFTKFLLLALFLHLLSTIVANSGRISIKHGVTDAKNRITKV